MKRRTAVLERQIQKIKQQLMALGNLQPGSLSTQYNVCGNPTCRCKGTPPRKHGPYYQISFTRNGRSSTRFVRASNVPRVKQQLRNYRRLRELVDRWVTLETELANLMLAEDGDD
jgi:hypothetical protein